MSYETDTVSGIKAGDRVRLTFTEEDAEHVIIATAKDCWGGHLVVGDRILKAVVEDLGAIVELLAPEWHDALVVQAGGKTLAKHGADPDHPWGFVGGVSRYTTDFVAALGPVRVVVGADGEVVA